MAGKGPLLVILDQFEELLILDGAAQAGAFQKLIEDLATSPLPGIKLLLVYRSDYEPEIFKLDLPPPVHGQSAFRLGRYNQREAEEFLKEGGRLPSPEARKALFAGLDKIDGTQGLYRQITLNMVGLFLERMGDSLTTDPDRLIQGYLDQAIKEGDIESAAARSRILDTLVSDAGTKRPRRQSEIAEETGLPTHVMRWHLNGLGHVGDLA
jgi:hypothetical protein